MKQIDPVLWLLTGLVVFFTMCMFACEHFFKDDGQIFQGVMSLLSGFGGALLMRVTPKKGDVIHPEDTTTTPPVTGVQG